ncbi:MAG TPA: hypothetical protein VN911_16760 [Candidatus Acidoferrum sp.]|nr:hypothetical protein [Candidatus Acidoferrum sp.]
MIVTSMDRRHPFSEECVALVVSPQGCGFRTSQALPLETPVLLGDLPSGGSVSGRVASCLPLGTDGKQFLIGVALYNQENVWGITDPPEDWKVSSTASAATATSDVTMTSAKGKDVWPYNLFTERGKSHSGRK